MRYLVTGGAGFIGSNLVIALLEVGHDVTVLDDLSSAGAELLAGLDVELVTGDVRDEAAVAQAVEGREVIVHLAAFPGVAASVRDPRSCFAVNVGGTLNLLVAARDAGVGRFVFGSTCGALFGGVEPPVDETMPATPFSPYGASKAAAEALCRAFYGSYGLEAAILRFTNVYGPRFGHRSIAVREFLRAALDDKPFVIFGDGEQSRDFVFVGDVVDAMLLAAESPRAAGEALHIGSGVQTSLLDLVREVRKATGKEGLPVVHEPERPGEVRHVFTRTDKAAEVLGFRPRLDLAQGLARTWAWMSGA